MLKNKIKKLNVGMMTMVFLAVTSSTSAFAISTNGGNENECKNIASKIDKYMQEREKEKSFSGSILVSKKGKILIEKSYGMANYQLSVPNNPKTKFGIGSITKQFTATAILQLQEQGKLSVEDKINKYIPDYPKGDKITIHNLLNHTSGVADCEVYNKDTERKSYTPETVLSIFKNKPFDFEPGEKFKYSNSGYEILGYIIEKVSGKSYEQYLNDNILKKANLKDTGYESLEKVIENKASGYKVKESKIINCGFVDPSYAYAAGSMYSTVEDLHKWNDALLGSKVLSKEATKKMVNSYTKTNFYDAYYGYGLFIGEFKIGDIEKKSIFHGGDNEGVAANNAIYLDDDVQVIILSNFDSAPVQRIHQDVSRIIFNQKLDDEKIIKINPKVYNNYVGKYVLDGVNKEFDIVKENDKIFFSVNTINKELYPIYEGNDKGTYTDKENFNIEFYKDTNGAVSHVEYINILNNKSSGKKIK